MHVVAVGVVVIRSFIDAIVADVIIVVVMVVVVTATVYAV
jgi:hypothetical protein